MLSVGTLLTVFCAGFFARRHRTCPTKNVRLFFSGQRNEGIPCKMMAAAIILPFGMPARTDLFIYRNIKKGPAPAAPFCMFHVLDVRIQRWISLTAKKARTVIIARKIIVRIISCEYKACHCL